MLTCSRILGNTPTARRQAARRRTPPVRGMTHYPVHPALTRICSTCRVEYHEVDCENGGDSLYQECMLIQDAKECPGCHVPIERRMSALRDVRAHVVTHIYIYTQAQGGKNRSVQ